MQEIIDDINKSLKEVHHVNKSYVLHYLWGAIQSEVRSGETAVSYEKLIKLIQEAIEEVQKDMK